MSEIQSQYFKIHVTFLRWVKAPNPKRRTVLKQRTKLLSLKFNFSTNIGVPVSTFIDETKQHSNVIVSIFYRKLFQSTRLNIKGIVRRSASKCAWQMIRFWCQSYERQVLCQSRNLSQVFHWFNTFTIVMLWITGANLVSTSIEFKIRWNS